MSDSDSAAAVWSARICAPSSTLPGAGSSSGSHVVPEPEPEPESVPEAVPESPLEVLVEVADAPDAIEFSKDSAAVFAPETCPSSSKGGVANAPSSSSIIELTVLGKEVVDDVSPCSCFFATHPSFFTLVTELLKLSKEDLRVEHAAFSCASGNP